MTQQQGLRCRHCLNWVDVRDNQRRCPRCGEDLTLQPLPDLPQRAATATGGSLEGPAFAEEGTRDDTAPLSEFLAAGSVLLGLFLFVAGIAIASATVMVAGFFVMLFVTGFFAIFGKRSSLRRLPGSLPGLVIPRWMSGHDRDRDK